MWRNVVSVVAGVLVVLGVLGAARAQKVPERDVAKIKKALPAKAPAKPARPRKVLVFSVCNGFHHTGAIERAKVAIPLMGEATGAYEAVVSDDLSNFEPDKIKQFDVIVLNNTTGELLKCPDKDRMKALRESFMNWVQAGGGIVGIHSATDCSYNWKDYGQMIGGYFAGHPWNQKVPVRIDDPTSPLTAVFKGKGFEIADEIYQFNRGVYSRYRQRVLLSLDPSKMDEKTLNRGARKQDHDYAVSWVKMCGKGRVFYCSLGHRNEIFYTPDILAYYLAGLQWAAGDLKGVSTEPNPLPQSQKPKD